jgi:hypothetical protein
MKQTDRKTNKRVEGEYVRFEEGIEATNKPWGLTIRQSVLGPVHLNLNQQL